MKVTLSKTLDVDLNIYEYYIKIQDGDLEYDCKAQVDIEDIQQLKSIEVNNQVLRAMISDVVSKHPELLPAQETLMIILMGLAGN